MSKKNKKKIILVEIKKTSYFLGPFWVKYKIIAADTSYKKEKKNWEIPYHFFHLLFGCRTANVGSLSRGQGNVNDLMLICAYIQLSILSSPGARNEIGFLSPAECLVKFAPGTFRFICSFLDWKSLSWVSKII